MDKKKHTLIVVVGPTAIGKTELAIEIAQFFKTEIVSADSRQFFKEMSIGTAKPSQEELDTVKHHFINSHEVSSFFSTGDFEVEALNLLNELFKKHEIVVMVGGSGLYIDAVCKGLDDLPEIDLQVREKLNLQLEQEGLSSIQKQLEELDPEYFEKVDQSNPQRMIRGLEVVLSTGKKLSSFLTNTKKQRAFEIIKIGLNTDRELVYDRINKRVDLMMEQGLLGEVKSLLPYRHLNALKTVGYTELFDFIDGNIDLPEAIALIKQNTRRFAKRQLTWFRRDLETAWFDPKDKDEIFVFLQQQIMN